MSLLRQLAITTTIHVFILLFYLYCWLVNSVFITQHGVRLLKNFLVVGFIFGYQMYGQRELLHSKTPNMKTMTLFDILNWAQILNNFIIIQVGGQCLHQNKKDVFEYGNGRCEHQNRENKCTNRICNLILRLKEEYKWKFRRIISFNCNHSLNLL